MGVGVGIGVCVCACLKIQMLKQLMLLSGGAVGKGLSQESASLQSGISAFVEEALESFLDLSTGGGYSVPGLGLRQTQTQLPPCWAP